MTRRPTLLAAVPTPPVPLSAPLVAVSGRTLIVVTRSAFHLAAVSTPLLGITVRAPLALAGATAL